MLRITVDLFPHGDKNKKQTLGILEIWNDGTGTEENGNYKFWISKANTTTIVKWRGAVQNFKRLEESVWRLLYLSLKQIFGDKDDKQNTK